ncbi:MAG: hypothetical protein KBD56_01290 [Candidatus Eisenbacteria bacterium]|nr:hypothetical protein [Candidatus Eisenbacteria bacterium]
MKDGLSWERFRGQAETSMCRECECGARRPWRGNATCVQSWLRYHSSRGIILTCSAAGQPCGRTRMEDTLMSEGTAGRQLAG